MIFRARRLRRPSPPGPAVAFLAFALLFGTSAAGADALVTRDGRRMLVQPFGEIKEGFNLFRLPGGQVFGLDRDEIDLEATREANAAPPPSYHTIPYGGIPGRRAERNYTVLGREETAPATKPITLHLRDAPVADILRVLADSAGLNLVLHPDVKGTLTLDLREVPWPRALEIVLKSAGLGSELRGNVLYVAPVRALLQEARDSQTLRQARR